jgi:hypothetical protein
VQKSKAQHRTVIQAFIEPGEQNTINTKRRKLLVGLNRASSETRNIQPFFQFMTQFLELRFAFDPKRQTFVNKSL